MNKTIQKLTLPLLWTGIAGWIGMAGAPIAYAQTAPAPKPTAAQKPSQRVATVLVDDFETTLNGWLVKKAENGAIADNTDARLEITNDAAQVKEGKGALRYEYPVVAGSVPVLIRPKPIDLKGMHTAHFWVKVSNPTVLLLGMNDDTHHSYQSPFYCPAGSWQEMTLRLDELTPSNDAQAATGALDLAHIQSLYLIDYAGGLAAMDTTLKGSRRLLLDDFSFSAQNIPQTTGKSKTIAGMPTYGIDNFESSLIRWVPLVLKTEGGATISFVQPDATVKIDNHTLAYTYNRRDKAASGILRNLEAVDLTGATDLSLRIHSLLAGTYMLSLEKKNGARYQRPIKLIESDGWKPFTFPLSSFSPAEGSQDPDGHLDAKDLRQISLADVTSLTPNTAPKTGQNTLYLDDVQFLYGTNGTDL